MILLSISELLKFSGMNQMAIFLGQNRHLGLRLLFLKMPAISITTGTIT
jgi:hypothetical protein